MNSKAELLIQLTDQLVEAFNAEDWDAVLNIQEQRNACLAELQAQLEPETMHKEDADLLRKQLTHALEIERTCLNKAKITQKQLVESQRKNQKGKNMKKAYGAHR